MSDSTIPSKRNPFDPPPEHTPDSETPPSMQAEPLASHEVSSEDTSPPLSDDEDIEDQLEIPEVDEESPKSDEVDSEEKIEDIEGTGEESTEVPEEQPETKDEAEQSSLDETDEVKTSEPEKPEDMRPQVHDIPRAGQAFVDQAGNLFEDQDKRKQNRQEAYNRRMQPGFEPVDPLDLDRIRQVFVGPPDFAIFLQEKIKSYGDNEFIFLIIGEPNSGRYAAALRLALVLQDDTYDDEAVTQADNIVNRGNNKNNHIYEYNLYASPSLNLRNIVHNVAEGQTPASLQNSYNDDTDFQSLPSNSVVIIRDAFEEPSGIVLQELTRRNKGVFREILKRSAKTRFILTATLDVQQWRQIESFPYTSTKGITPNHLEEIYWRHLAYRFPDDDFLGADEKALRDMLWNGREDVLPILGESPTIIYYFVERCINKNPQDLKQAQEIAEALVVKASTRAWFEDLLLHQKLYALLAFLLRGLNWHDLNTIYDEAVRRLREDGVDGASLKDLRYFGVEDFLEEIQLELKRRGKGKVEVLEFKERRYFEEVNRQLKNHYRLIWWLKDLLVAKIEEMREDELPCRILANALGQIGSVHPPMLEADLGALASNPDGRIAIAAGDALNALCANIDHHSFLRGILTRWLHSRNSELMWAAAAAIGIVYDTVNRLIHTREDVPNIANDDRDDHFQIADRTRTYLLELLDWLGRNVGDFDTSELDGQAKSLIAQFNEAIATEIEEPEILHALQSSFAQEIEARLESHKTALQDQLVMAVVGAIQQINRNNPEDAVEMIKQWLAEEPGAQLWRIARMAANQLYRSTVEGNVQWIDERSLPILNLLPDMLHASINISTDVDEVMTTLIFGMHMAAEGVMEHRAHITELIMETPIATALRTLLEWHRILTENIEAEATVLETDEVDELQVAEGDIDNDLEVSFWNEHVYPHLLELVNSAASNTRLLLRGVLIEMWLDSDSDEVRRFAFALLTRLYVMEGIVMDLPVTRYGVLVVDAGQQVRNEYLNAVFELSQRLATLTPLHIYHLGREKMTLCAGQYRCEKTENEISITSRTLDMAYPPRPRLLMPFLEPLQASTPLDPAICHFVLTLNLEEIIDLSDLLDQAEPYLIKARFSQPKFDPFAPPAETQLIEKREVSSWPWGGKFFVINQQSTDWWSEEAKQRPDVSSLVRWLEPTEQPLPAYQLERIEADLQQQIIHNLHDLSLSEWANDLAAYSNLSSESLRDPQTLIAQLDAWTQELSNVGETLPPRDVSLAIAWTVLLLSRHSPDLIVPLVRSWLESDNVQKQRIGIACTKLLFNFYSVQEPAPPIETFEIFLSLISPFMQHCQGYAEFAPFLIHILNWAKDEAWSERLLYRPDQPASELMDGLVWIKEQEDIDWLLGAISRREALLKLLLPFIQLGLGFKTFIDRVNEIIEWVNQERERQQNKHLRKQPESRARQISAEKLITPPSGINKDTARELLQIPRLTNDDQRWVLQQIWQNEDQLLDPKRRETYIQELRNQKTVLDRVRLQLYSTRGGELPKLTEGQQYALVILDTSTVIPSVRRQITKEANEFLSLLHEQQVSVKTPVWFPVVHRLGRQEIFFTYGGTGKKPRFKSEDLWPANLPRYAPLIGPILERYSLEQVGFVLILTATPIPDLQDWIELPEWPGQLWVYAVTPQGSAAGINQVQMQTNSQGEVGPRFEDIIRRSTS